MKTVSEVAKVALFTFILLLMAQTGFGQEKAGPSFLIGTKASYINNTWRNTFNESIGMYGEGNFPLLRKVT